MWLNKSPLLHPSQASLLNMNKGWGMLVPGSSQGFLSASRTCLFYYLKKKFFFSLKRGQCPHWQTHSFLRVSRVEVRWSWVPSKSLAPPSSGPQAHPWHQEGPLGWPYPQTRGESGVTDFKLLLTVFSKVRIVHVLWILGKIIEVFAVPGALSWPGWGRPSS